MKNIVKKLKNLFRYYLKIDKYGRLKNNTINLKLGKNVEINPLSQVFLGSNISISKNTIINTSSNGKSQIHIHNDVIIGHNVLIIGGNHEFSDINIPMRLQGEGKGGNIIIEEDVWIGAGSIILTDVKIGKGSIIGAGSVVTKDIASYSIAVGNPARVIKKRNLVKD